MIRGLLPRLRSAWPGSDLVQSGISRPRFVRLRLERFPRGVDNLHIDVALGPVLGRATTAYVATLVRENVHRLWKQPATEYNDAALEGFGRVVEAYHRAAVVEARESNSRERLQLFQLALLKLALNLVDSELSALRLKLDDARSLPARQLSGQSLQIHQQAVMLGRYAGHIRFCSARQLIREIMRLEHGGMRGLRKQQLGLSWPIPEVMLNNPILQLDGVGGAGDFSRVYPILLHDLEVTRRVGRCVLQTLSAWLPGNVDPDSEELSEGHRPPLVNRRDQGYARGFVETERWLRHLVSPKELSDCSANWLDLPENATRLLGGAEADWPRPGDWRHPGIARLQRELSRQLAAGLARAGLMRAVIAAYELFALYPSLGMVDAEPLVFVFLKGTVNRRDMLRRLTGMDGVAEPAVVLRRIEELRKEYKATPGAGRRQMMARIAGDFLRLRRDLKLAWRAFAGMDSLRLDMDERELALSRANNTLQVFDCGDLATDTRGSVIGHVIIRVDVRGLNEATAQMRRRNLSPAAHFSRYFYDPLSRLLERFDVRKVAVQSDALTLSALEYGDTGGEHLAVARACWVAAKLLELAAVMNTENERIGLCRIELGLGISYADEAPTYLYDQGQTITLSPAMHRARRLASCHARLRKACELPGGRGLCVAAKVRGGTAGGRLGEGLVRCNVDSIELDDLAFAQLNVEIPLRRLNVRDRRGKHPVILHAGSCPDLSGVSQPLLVREQAVKLWMGTQLLDAADHGRRYFELVTDARLLKRVSDRLSGADAGAPKTAPGARQ